MKEATAATYKLIDSGDKIKLEQFGPYLLSRPCAQALWPKRQEAAWPSAHGTFSREQQEGWQFREALPASWTVTIDSMTMQVRPTDFGHLGLFPEQRPFWSNVRGTVHPGTKVLNLFAYSGGATIAAAQGGASVCHVDSSKGMLQWARENALVNGLEKAPIRWICEDVIKFLHREIKRKSQYDGVILDPPSFGRGTKGEVFKVESEITHLLQLCREVLSPTPLFLLFSCHTPSFTPTTMRYLLEDMFGGGRGSMETGEMFLTGDTATRAVPSGTYAFWRN